MWLDNKCRWDGATAPHYEVWFLTLNHRESQRGFWFRYVLDSRLDTVDDSRGCASLWAAIFNRRSPEQNFGIKCEYSIDHCSFNAQDGSGLTLGDGVFTGCTASGHIQTTEHKVEWDLRYVPCEKTYQHVSRAVIRLARPSSFVCSPNVATTFTGRIVVDGAEIILDSEPGCQSHLWGRKHVDEWVWVHSNAFESFSDTVFEGLAARARRAGQMLPPIQSLYLRHRGEEHRFVRLRFAEQWQTKLGMGYWSFSAMNTRFYIEGAAQCRLRDMLQAEYTDPDGERIYCINSEVANLKMRLFKRVHGVRWRHVETIKSYATAHLEHAGRLSDSDVLKAFESPGG